MTDNNQKIRITWDDVNAARAPSPAPVAAPTYGPGQGAGARNWGSVSNNPTYGSSIASPGGNVLLKAWVYLGGAGLAGAFLAWAVTEPFFTDGASRGLADYFMFPLMAILMCVGFGMAESIVERSWPRAISRGLAALALGLVLGIVFDVVANVIYRVLSNALVSSGANVKTLVTNPAFWLVRAFAWAVFGVAGGLVFGIVSKSGKKTLYGMLGGFIGAGIGGVLFDPIALVTNSGEASRMVGMSILGACTGVAIGLVESALKDRWLYVSAGPLAGKQFVLYQGLVTIGKSQSSTIFLFKDPGILDHHATIELRSGASFLTALGPVAVNKQLLQGGMQHNLRSGDAIQVGRYTFSYEERARAGSQQ